MILIVVIGGGGGGGCQQEGKRVHVENNQFSSSSLEDLKMQQLQFDVNQSIRRCR